MDQLETLQKFMNLGAAMRNVREVMIEGVEASDAKLEGKPHRTYNQNEAMEACGIARKDTINDMCEKLGIEYKSDGKWKITQTNVQQLREHNGSVIPFERNPFTIVISSLKGGVGKTSLAATIASGLATQLHNNYKVLFIDVDPQGNGTNLLIPNFNKEEQLTFGDLLRNNFELDEGETFEDVCKAAICDTNIDNLKVLPAAEADANYEMYVKEREMEANEKGETYDSHNDVKRIHDALKEQFDFIIIDTPPRFSAPMLSAHYVADSLLIPFKPSENDRDATEKYLEFYERIYQLLIGLGHRGYHSIHEILSIVKNQSATQKKLATNIKRAIGDDCFSSQFSEREAVITCSTHNSTIYDVSASQYTKLFKGNRNTLISAQEEFDQILVEVEEEAKRFWGVAA